MRFFFFNDTATTEIYTLSLHDALPILDAGDRAEQGRAADPQAEGGSVMASTKTAPRMNRTGASVAPEEALKTAQRSEEHTSELQSRQYLVCRLLLEKKKQQDRYNENYA